MMNLPCTTQNTWTTCHRKQKAWRFRQFDVFSPILVALSSLIVLALFPLAGCGGKLPGRISGAVTLDGAPLRTGTIVFHPDMPGAAAYAAIDENGNYTVRTGNDQGLIPGDYVATVVATTGPPPNGKLLTPSRYGNVQQSGLRFAVAPGDNRIDIGLRTQ